MKNAFLLLVLISQCCFGNDIYWSKMGHRAIGEVAQEHLTRRAKKAIDKLLDGQDLAVVSNFGDEIKADSKYREFGTWHYVNIPKGKSYADIVPNENGDLIMGLQTCIRILKDKSSSKEDKVFYLKMLIHLIGDLHQPMHVGYIEDKGGNDIQVQWFNRGSNLHRVWDSNMIDDHGLSYTELAASIAELDKTERKEIQKGTILDWLADTQTIVDDVYASAEVGEKLSYRYSYDWWSTVEAQLQKGGLRLAKVLNHLF